MKTACRLILITLLVAASKLSAATHSVSLESTNATPPYTNWVTAATNIQDAVNVAVANDVVLVTNGVYPGGVPVTNALVLRSVNGPQFTVIDGGGQISGQTCVSLSDGSSLTGFTLRNGLVGVSATQNAVLTNCTLTGCGYGWGHGAVGGTLYDCTFFQNLASAGGGAYGCTLYHCTLRYNSAQFGGGASECTLYNCTLTLNSAVGLWVNGQFTPAYGGGAEHCTLYNCTVSDSTTTGRGGGVIYCVLHNCIVYYNTIGFNPNQVSNYDFWTGPIDYCCTTPQPFGGTDNIANEPMLVDHANEDLHLLSNSPCINAGNNANVTTTTDLDGNPRNVSGMVDIGAYEYQGTGSRISYAWLQQYGLPTDGSADYTDTYHDDMNNWQEWLCGTDPTDPLSVLRLLSPSITSTNAMVTWQSSASVNYSLERSANLVAPFTLLATNIVGQAGTTSYADTNTNGAGPIIYRVGMKSP
jgi:hypothetical protein